MIIQDNRGEPGVMDIVEELVHDQALFANRNYVDFSIKIKESNMGFNES